VTVHYTAKDPASKNSKIALVNTSAPGSGFYSEYRILYDLDTTLIIWDTSATRRSTHKILTFDTHNRVEKIEYLAGLKTPNGISWTKIDLKTVTYSDTSRLRPDTITTYIYDSTAQKYIYYYQKIWTYNDSAKVISALDRQYSKQTEHWGDYYSWGLTYNDSNQLIADSLQVWSGYNTPLKTDHISHYTYDSNSLLSEKLMRVPLANGQMKDTIKWVYSYNTITGKLQSVTRSDSLKSVMGWRP
jgi:hypothetical protein